MGKANCTLKKSLTGRIRTRGGPLAPLVITLAPSAIQEDPHRSYHAPINQGSADMQQEIEKIVDADYRNVMLDFSPLPESAAFMAAIFVTPEPKQSTSYLIRDLLA